MLRFQLGSSTFFKDFSDFIPHDLDYIEFHKDLSNLSRIKIKNSDYILAPTSWTKEDYIEDCKKLPMKAGKFLVPEFNEYVGFTIEDLPKIKEFFDNIDERHNYEKLIYDAYVDNQSFTLTDEQRNAAYEEYKKYR